MVSFLALRLLRRASAVSRSSSPLYSLHTSNEYGKREEVKTPMMVEGLLASLDHAVNEVTYHFKDSALKEIMFSAVSVFPRSAMARDEGRC